MRKKGEQRGSVRRRGGHWHISFYAWGANSKGEFGYWPQERKIPDSERMSRRQAQQAGFDEFVARANGPAKCAQAQATLQQFVDLRFRPEYMQVGLKKTGRAFYESILTNHVLPVLGPVKLADVNTSMVQGLIASKQEKLSPGTLRHIRNCLSAVFRHARSLSFYQGALPTESVRLPEMRENARRALTPQQLDALLAAIDPRYQALTRVLAETGLRIGEALGLRWANVNLDDAWKLSGSQAIPPNSLFVAEAWVRGERTTLKTATSRRIVPLTSGAWVALTLIQEGAKGVADGDASVFASRSGNPLDGHNIAARYLKPAAQAIGCPWASWHSLRHTAATRTDQFLTPAEKQALLGHASAAMSNRYTHPAVESVRKGLERATERMQVIPIKKEASA